MHYVPPLFLAFSLIAWWMCEVLQSGHDTGFHKISVADELPPDAINTIMNFVVVFHDRGWDKGMYISGSSMEPDGWYDERLRPIEHKVTHWMSAVDWAELERQDRESHLESIKK